MAVPKLRFKEFDENWKEVTLKNCITSIDSGWSPQCESYPANSSEWGVLKTTSVDWSGFNSSFNKKLPLELTPRKEIEVKPLDILVTRAGPTERVGVVSVVPHSVRSKLMISDKLIRLKSNEENNPLFLGISLSSVKCQNQLQSKTSGLAKSQTNISQKILGEVLLKLPSKEEQTKIASFLSAVDEKISQLTKKHELLSQYKQGMMQKLFSQQIRFKADDGSEFGEWEEVKFSDIFNFHQTNSYSRALLAEHGEIMNIHYGDIHTKFSMLFDVTKEPVPFLNDEVDTSKITNEQFLKVGDLVIADASEDYKDIGKAIEVISLNNQKVVAGLHTYIARPVKLFALGFCGYMMQTFPVREQIKKLATGISVLGISKTNLGKLELKVPFLEEQTKIANFLSAIDQKIEVVAQQIEQAKQWKKGLLQQMFV
ncbi:MAG: restriction endonuclease subunit S [Gammaproteobacteria bacterium]|nr:restriction endonuclease subunit S [Gammaproteobacteria bacterium]